MSLVIDTSVFISAILSKDGASREILRRCLTGRCVPLIGQTLFTEYEAVFERSELFAKARITKQERETLFHSFLNTCQWVRVYYLWRPNLQDEADNHVMELALAGGAAYIVTHNVRDFTHSELHFPSITVCTPGQFLREERSPWPH